MLYFLRFDLNKLYFFRNCFSLIWAHSVGAQTVMVACKTLWILNCWKDYSQNLAVLFKIIEDFLGVNELSILLYLLFPRIILNINFEWLVSADVINFKISYRGRWNFMKVYFRRLFWELQVIVNAKFCCVQQKHHNGLKNHKS